MSAEGGAASSKDERVRDANGRFFASGSTTAKRQRPCSDSEKNDANWRQRRRTLCERVWAWDADQQAWVSNTKLGID